MTRPIDRLVLGLWPLSGVTTKGVRREDAEGTLQAALDAGVRTFDSAFSYGYEGESDQLLGRAIQGRREEMVVIGKVGQRWSAAGERVVDARPEQLTADAETSLRRIGIDAFDLLFLHSPHPDESVPIERSAETMQRLVDRGLAAATGVCNVSDAQLRRFQAVTPAAAVQLPLNLLQQETLQHPIPWCQERGIGVFVYWTLMKGILAGRIGRDHQFPEGDSRPKYAIYQGEPRERTHRLVDALGLIAADTGKTVAQIAIGWTLAQPGVSATLIGAHRPEQIVETLGSEPLDAATLQRIEQALEATRAPG
jgi:aryl-alcohol dehydrogenase-like predicted oxidoreductase